MGKLDNTIYEIHEIDEWTKRELKINMVHPLIKLIVTIIYIACVVSIDKYDLIGLLPFLLYPAIIFVLADISMKKAFKKLRIVLPFVCLIGIFNPIFDHTPILRISNVVITGGMISMVTLVMKGIFTLLASFLLIVTTGIERICYAMQLLHIPKFIITQVLLTYRYITVLLGEANAISQAYSLRAPKEKGIRYKVWGSLLGQLLFRSIDRAEKLYDSMLLRGFRGEFYANCEKCNGLDYCYLFLWTGIFSALKIVNIMT